MITLDKFNFIKDEHGDYASWAVWAKQEETPTSKIDDLNVLDPAINRNLLFILNPNVVFVGLNKSRDGNKKHFSNFHSKDSGSNDFKIRYAFKDSLYWGGYMTDIIKGLKEKDSLKVKKILRENEDFERQNVKRFRKELEDIGASKPTLIAFGKIAHEILERNLNDEFNILGIYHYACRKNKVDYRAHVRSELEF